MIWSGPRLDHFGMSSITVISDGKNSRVIIGSEAKTQADEMDKALDETEKEMEREEAAE